VDNLWACVGRGGGGGPSLTSFGPWGVGGGGVQRGCSCSLWTNPIRYPCPSFVRESRGFGGQLQFL
jgi:hypothetical protein